MTTETFLAYLGIVLAIIGLVASYYFYRKSVRIKEPVYSIKSNNLISGSKSRYENLRVLYGKTEVENFTVSKILFFNRGSETIARKDTETRYPLRISTKGCQILDAFVLQVNKSSNNFTLLWDKSGKFLNIDFDYLDKNQGGVIQIAHTGISSENIKIEGDIMGVSKLVELPSKALQMANSKPSKKDRRIRYMINAFGIIGLLSGLFLLSVILMAATTGNDFFSTLKETRTGIYDFWYAVFYLFTGIIILGYRLFSSARRDRKIPQGLEKFLE